MKDGAGGRVKERAGVMAGVGIENECEVVRIGGQE